MIKLIKYIFKNESVKIQKPESSGEGTKGQSEINDPMKLIINLKY